MKLHLLTVCLLLSLAGGARAEEGPETEVPAAPPAPSSQVLRQEPEALRQELEARRRAIEAGQRALAAELEQLEAEVQRLDPEERLTSGQLYSLLMERERRSCADSWRMSDEWPR